MFFIDASTTHTISTDMKCIAEAKGSGKSVQDALLWLSGKQQRWLLLLDNADDPKVNLRDYFPKCSHGDILITSRNHAVCTHASGLPSRCNIARLSLDDARDLLIRVASPTQTDETGMMVTAIVKVC